MRDGAVQRIVIPMLVIDDKWDNSGEAIPGSEKDVTVVHTSHHTRIIFGDADDDDAPDIYIERRPGGFDVVFHPGNGRDPLLAVEWREAGAKVVDCTGYKTLAFVEAD